MTTNTVALPRAGEGWGEGADHHAHLRHRLWLTFALLPLALAAQPISPPDTRRSGLDFMSPALQALQRDDSQNPALLWVQDGAVLWRTATGNAGKSCADCHGDASKTLPGVATRYPAWSESTNALTNTLTNALTNALTNTLTNASTNPPPPAAAGQALNLAGRVNTCRQRHQQAPPLASEQADLLALTAYLGFLSRARPVAPPDDARLAPLRAQGQALWGQRLGQLNLACTHCHDQRAGARLGGAAIPQGHATGYPTYRLEWQGLGSLQRRLRGCVVGVRAEPFAPDAPEWLALEAYLAQRGAGLLVETPAVRP